MLQHRIASGFSKNRNHHSEFTDLIILILDYFERRIGIMQHPRSSSLLGWIFEAGKGFDMNTQLTISSSHYQQFTSLFRF